MSLVHLKKVIFAVIGIFQNIILEVVIIAVIYYWCLLELKVLVF